MFHHKLPSVVLEVSMLVSVPWLQSFQTMKGRNSVLRFQLFVVHVAVCRAARRSMETSWEISESSSSSSESPSSDHIEQSARQSSTHLAKRGRGRGKGFISKDLRALRDGMLRQSGLLLDDDDDDDADKASKRRAVSQHIPC